MRRDALRALVAIVVCAFPACVFWDLGQLVGPPSVDGGFLSEATRDAHDARRMDAGANDADAGRSAYARLVLMDQPLGFYELNDKEDSGIAIDTSHGHNAIAHNVKFGVPGQVGTAAYFSAGASASIVAGALYGFAADSPFSIEAWVKQPIVSAGNYVYILARRTVNPRQGYDFWVAPAPDAGLLTASFELDLPDASTAKLNTIVDFSIDASAVSYVHLVGTYGNSGGGLIAQIYRNGERSFEVNNASTSPEVDASFIIGAGPEGGEFNLTGYLDEIAIYDHVLDGGTIQQHYQAGLASAH
jgi:hypothetical protein